MSLKSSIKSTAMRVAPRLAMEVLSNRSQRLIMRIERETGRVQASQQYIRSQGAEVQAGPFKGMRYPDFSCRSRNLIPKLVASYEDELYPWVEEAIGKGYRQIVNIGTADGYYTVGLALRVPRAHVVGFDTDRWARKATRALAAENGADNVEVLSMCTTEWLMRRLEPGALLLVDCEGCEAHLLDVNRAPILSSCDLIVELHDAQAPGIADKLKAWFGKTHDIRSIDARPKNPAGYGTLGIVSRDLQASVISEGRHGPQEWYFITRKEVGIPSEQGA